MSEFEIVITIFIMSWWVATIVCIMFANSTTKKFEAQLDAERSERQKFERDFIKHIVTHYPEHVYSYFRIEVCSQCEHQKGCLRNPEDIVKCKKFENYM